MTNVHVINATRARVRPRGLACHVGPRAKPIFFYFFINIFIIIKQLKSKINQIKFRKIPEKFYKFVKIITFKIQLQISSNLFCWIHN